MSTPLASTHTFSRTFVRTATIACAAVIFTACADSTPTSLDAPGAPVAPSDTTSRPASPLAKLRVYGSDAVQMFDTLRFGVEAVDADGRVLPTPALYTDVVEQPAGAVVTLDASGFSARTEGEYRIRVASGPTTSAYAVADTFTVQVRGTPEVLFAVSGLDSLSVATSADWTVHTAFTRGGLMSPSALPRTITVEDTTVAVFVAGADGESGRLEARAPGVTEVVTRVLGGQVSRKSIRVVARPITEMRVSSDRGDSTLYVRDNEVLTTAVMDSGSVAFRDVPCDVRVLEGQSISIAPSDAGCAAHALEAGLTVLEFNIGGIKLRVERWVREPDETSVLSPRVSTSRVVNSRVVTSRVVSVRR